MTVGSSTSPVQVFARVRPAKSKDWSEAVPWTQACEATQAVHVLQQKPAADGSTSLEVQKFAFDGVFPPEAAQQDVFATVGRPVLKACLRGINGTIFAYGQTGSGKTHSMLQQGTDGTDDGILPRLAYELFGHIASDPTSKYEVEIAAMQVYNESVDDLLHAGYKASFGQNLEVPSNGDAEGLTWVRCRQGVQLCAAVYLARANLSHAETKLNKAANHSHVVFQIKLSRQGPEASTCARLSIVDVAGSECVRMNGLEGTNRSEAAATSKSLLVLGNVVAAIATNKRQVLFHDSKLTHILKPYIGGNCKTVLLLCASPSKEHTRETLRSLQFGTRAMGVDEQIKPKVNTHECTSITSVDCTRERVSSQASTQATSEPEEEDIYDLPLASLPLPNMEAAARPEKAEPATPLAAKARRAMARRDCSKENCASPSKKSKHANGLSDGRLSTPLPARQQPSHPRLQHKSDTLSLCRKVLSR